MGARAEIFKALGHPARLTMVTALGTEERCVCDLQELVGSDMSTVSKHLAVLRAVGVRSRTILTLFLSRAVLMGLAGVAVGLG